MCHDFFNIMIDMGFGVLYFPAFDFGQIFNLGPFVSIAYYSKYTSIRVYRTQTE